MHMCRSRLIFASSKDLCTNFLKRAQKYSKENDLQKQNKKRVHFLSRWAHFFRSKHFNHHICRHSPQTCPNFPLTCPNFTCLARKELYENMTFKKVCTLISADTFVKSKHIQRFCQSIHKICPHFHRFDGFRQIKSFGGVLSSPAPPPLTPEDPCIEMFNLHPTSCVLRWHKEHSFFLVKVEPILIGM